MSNQDQKETSPPWYRVGMVWLIIALPLVVVVASMITVTIAHKSAPTIVTPKHPE